MTKKIRVDKFLSNMGVASRSQVKKLIKRGALRVNQQVINAAKHQIDPNNEQVYLYGKRIPYRPYVYLMLNKPAGYISSTDSRDGKTVLDLVSAPYRHYDLFPVGRLDKDSTGLLLLSNDGALAHRLLSPKRHVSKTYRVTLRDAITAEAIARLKEGIVLSDFTTKPAQLQRVNDRTLILSISEGKYHQVKRMIGALDNYVLSLERIGFGPLTLDRSLARGDIRQLSQSELEQLATATGSEIK